MFPGCYFLNENDGSLHYSEGWSFVTSDPNGLVHTLHFTQTPGTSVSLMLNASTVVVFGLVPSGSSPPQASYSINGLPATSPHMGATTQCVPNQQLFNSGNLTAGVHNLTIEVTTASKDEPYILDYLWEQESDSEKLKRQRNSSTSEAGDAVTTLQVSSPSPPEPLETTRADVPVNECSLEEGTTLSGVSNVATGGYLASAIEGDGPPSSLALAPSTNSTVLARRLDKVVRFRSPIALRWSSPTPQARHSTGESGVRTKLDEPPPPYVST
ncbi:hypothetical protein V8D89_002730 [Ganoderma adspersum]